jgi:hypothetical protein
MEPNKSKVSVKDFFLNIGSIVALYTVVITLVTLLFTIINTAYPQVTNGYYSSSASISWPVATLIIAFPILIALMWLLEKQYKVEPERQNAGIHKWLTYLTLFVAGVVLAGDLITVIYYFIDGRELTTGFLLKVVALLVVSGGLFLYYVSDVRGQLTSGSRKIWRIASALVIIASIVWGFSVLGSPRTQRLYKYDEQKVNDLMNINQYVINYYQTHAGLPGSLSDLTAEPNNYAVTPVDMQSGKPYEYKLIGQSAKAYELCAEFNKPSNDKNINGRSMPVSPYGGTFWSHPAGRHCFTQTIDPRMYPSLKI